MNRIITTCDSAIRNGVQIIICWIPSHCGIKGNDLADKNAKLAAEDPKDVYNLGLSFTELRSQVKATVWRQWEVKLKEYCNSRTEDLDLPTVLLHCNKINTPNFPRENIRILARLRTRCPKYRYTIRHCKCGKVENFTHLVLGCHHLPNSLKPIWNLREKYGLTKDDFLKPHATLQDLPMRVLTDCIISSSLRDWF